MIFSPVLLLILTKYTPLENVLKSISVDRLSTDFDNNCFPRIEWISTDVITEELLIWRTSLTGFGYTVKLLKSDSLIPKVWTNVVVHVFVIIAGLKSK